MKKVMYLIFHKNKGLNERRLNVITITIVIHMLHTYFHYCLNTERCKRQKEQKNILEAKLRNT
jgi:hypothetical protein